jgi:type II restriction/modification system DNA methylase subunit YeeA
MTTRLFSYALKGKLPGGRCLVIVGTEGFTPNWIVKYMVQNTLGAKWLAAYPQSGIRAKMAYYIEPAQQTDEVKAKLEASTPKELNPQEITFLDPACGSGHILVEAYDLFKEIYLERGYVLREIPRLILEKNLFGLDIDDRASQLACFSLLMRARADDRRILWKPLDFNVAAIQETGRLNPADISNIVSPSVRNELMPSNDLFPDTLKQPPLSYTPTPNSLTMHIHNLINSFEFGKAFGSLIHIPSTIDNVALRALENTCLSTPTGNTLDDAVKSALLKGFVSIIKQSYIIGGQYDCVVTNPPYMGRKFLNNCVKSGLKISFSNFDNDLFSAFIIRNLKYSKPDGALGFMTPMVWMFISTHEELRTAILRNSTLASLIQLEYNASGEVRVPLCTFIIYRQYLKQYAGSYIRLTEFGGYDNQSIKTLEAIRNPECEWFHVAKPDDFMNITGCPIAYWLEKPALEVFNKSAPLSSIAEPRQGIATADNDRFMRIWTEVDWSKVLISANCAEDVNRARAKWIPYNKGGKYRKWYGNREFVINWADDGREIKNFRDKDGNQRSAVRNPSFFFKEGATWSLISSSYFGVRWTPIGCIFDVGGSCIFPPTEQMGLVISLLSSRLATYFLAAINPTLNFQVGNIGNIPYLKDVLSEIREPVTNNFLEAVSISKDDWDSFEISWDFLRHPIIYNGKKPNTLDESFGVWTCIAKSRFDRMQFIESENNRLLIAAYGMDLILKYEVTDGEITLKRADRANDIKSLISYSVGCMMGRYSLDETGLIYANSGNVGFDQGRYIKFPADDDGIVPIMQTDWFEDDATVRFTEFLKVAWSPETLTENLRFVADSLGPKSGETATDTIRRYFNSEFFKDHLKTYKKRPIYWLFSSGKEKAFEALVYLHRYNEGTLSRMRMEYVTPLQGRIANRIDQLGRDLDATSGTAARNKLAKELEKLKKQQAELRRYDEELRHFADMSIKIDLDDGVKVNYGKFGNLLAEVKAITGGSDE